ncbi:MAG: transposase [Stackebrandtia sp.]
MTPIEVSSSDPVRHRLSRAGDRQLNDTLHVMALAQIRHDGPGRSYYQRKRAAEKSHKEAIRCLKRRPSDVDYRTMINDTISSLTPDARHREMPLNPHEPPRRVRRLWCVPGAA